MPSSSSSAPWPDYGTNPTTTSAVKSHGRALASGLRPWRDLLDPSALSLPISLSDAASRSRQNVLYFRSNYALFALIVLFVSLVYHPLSLVLFLLLFLAWIFLYFARDDDHPILFLGRVVDDRIVLFGLFFLTVVVLAFTHVGLNVLVALMVAAVIVGLHSAFRITDDLGFDEQDASERGLLSVVDSPPQHQQRY